MMTILWLQQSSSWREACKQQVLMDISREAKLLMMTSLLSKIVVNKEDLIRYSLEAYHAD